MNGQGLLWLENLPRRMVTRAIYGAPATTTLDLVPDVGVEFTRLSEGIASRTPKQKSFNCY